VVTGLRDAGMDAMRRGIAKRITRFPLELAQMQFASENGLAYEIL
jgi:hypothetical protein